MKKLWLLTALLMVTSIAPAKAQLMLESKNIKDGSTLTYAQVYQGFGCEGANVSPALNWSGAPAETQSFAVTVFDPDAPTGSGWWHWLAFNIPADTQSLPAGASLRAMPEGTIEATTDFGSTGFGGACPPKGDKPHRYIFKVHALDVEKLPLDETASGAKVGYFLGVHALDVAEITATYGR